MSAKERAAATAEELIEKLEECLDLANTISSTLWTDEYATRKFSDVALAIWTIRKEVDQYDFGKE